MARPKRVLLAPVRIGERPIPVHPDAQGRAIVDGDEWMVVDVDLAWRLAQMGVTRGTRWTDVVAKLQLRGYWPAWFALVRWARGET